MDILKTLRAQWDRAAAWIALAVGVLLLYLGFRGTSDAQHIVLQMPYVVSGGLGGLFLLGVAAMLWVSADLRDQWHEVHHLREAVERLSEGSPQPSTEPVVNGVALAEEEGRPARARRRKLVSSDRADTNGG